MTKRILLVGGTGAFGSLLAGHLAVVPGIELILASRSQSKASGLADKLRAGATARISACRFDRNGNPQRQLDSIKPWLVIDASGPFQSCDYAFAGAAIACRAHWIDLADARGYLLGFATALDALAKDHGVTAIAGASSTPALSSAVVAELTKGWQRVDTIDLAIFPGGAGKVGRAVIAAILSYAGTPIPQWRDGKQHEVRGWSWPVRTNVPDLGQRFISSVETADDALLAQAFSVRDRVAFYAGLESRLEHFGLAALAALPAHGLPLDLTRLAPLLARARRLTGLWASDRGAMTVEVTGLDETGAHACAHWRLLAGRGHGPHVPILPALALTRRLLAAPAVPGARTGCCELALAAIESEMRPLSITTIRQASAACRTECCGFPPQKRPGTGRRSSGVVDSPQSGRTCDA
jgi:hypothetical protein